MKMRWSWLQKLEVSGSRKIVWVLQVAILTGDVVSMGDLPTLTIHSERFYESNIGLELEINYNQCMHQNYK